MKYYEQKYKKRKRRKAIVLLSIFVSFFVCAFVYVYCVVNPLVVNAVQHMIFSLSTTAVSDAVYDVLKENDITYEDLVEIEHDAQGDVSLLYLKTVTLNLIARRFYQVAQINLDNMGKNGLDVALGAFTGLPFLVGTGPKVNLKMVSIGAMTSTFESRFSTAGINQTNHSLFIRLYASVSLILPVTTKKIDSTTEMLVAESVIVGKVPEIYLGGNATLSYTPQ